MNILFFSLLGYHRKIEIGRNRKRTVKDARVRQQMEH